MIRKRRSRYIGVAAGIAKRLGLAFDSTDWPAIWELIEAHGEPTYVYAIVDSEAGLVKFGRSVNPGQRLSSLQTANGNRLKLWAFCKEQGELTEKSIHVALHQHRVGGEWFKLCVATGDTIDKIRSTARAQ